MSSTLHLAKQNFKFSAAHFLIFDQHNAEKLHGHNYQVKVDLSYESQLSHQQAGFFIDFNIFKKQIKQRLDQWDEHVLLPELHPEMLFQSSADKKNYEIKFRDRFYSLPKTEVIWLKVTNTSVEAFSKILAEEFLQEFSSYGISKIRVTVQETSGQAASWVSVKK